jgi:hypothetical protein
MAGDLKEKEGVREIIFQKLPGSAVTFICGD